MWASQCHAEHVPLDNGLGLAQAFRQKRRSGHFLRVQVLAKHIKRRCKPAARLCLDGDTLAANCIAGYISMTVGDAGDCVPSPQ